MIPVLAGLAGLAMLCNPGKRKKRRRRNPSASRRKAAAKRRLMARAERAFQQIHRTGSEFGRGAKTRSKRLTVAWKVGRRGARTIHGAGLRGMQRSRRGVHTWASMAANPSKAPSRGAAYKKAFDQGVQAAKSGNAWLSSAPLKGWRGEAWKDGMWSVIHPFHKNPPDISIRWVKIHDPKHKGWVAECYQPGGHPIQRFWGKTKAACIKKINDRAEGN